MDPRRDAGMTMVELLVAIAILSVVVAGVMETFVVNNRAYTVVDETTSAQQDLRAISHLIERDLRATGFMVPESAAACGIDRTDAPDTLYVTDPEPIDPTNQAQANLGANVLSGYTGATGSVLSLRVADVVLDGAPFFDSDGDGAADSDFRCAAGAGSCGGAGGAVILFDVGNPARGTACGEIVDFIPPDTLRVEFETSIGGGAGSLSIVPALRYTVEPDPVSGALTLMRNQIALATDVEDFQVAWFVDADGNGAVSNANEYRGSAASTIDYASNAVDHSELREVRFNVVMRSRNPDPEYNQGLFQAMENRGAAAAADGFRRRVLTSIVRPRNLGYRGAQPSGV